MLDMKMKKIYVSPVIGAEEVLVEDIICTSPEDVPQKVSGSYATQQMGDDGDALSKDFSNFSFDDFGF